MVGVDKVYKGVQYLANKSQRGGYIPPIDFNREAPVAFYEIINDRVTNLSQLRYQAPYAVRGLEQTNRSSDALSDIIATTSVLVGADGQLTKPDDFMHVLKISSNSILTVEDNQISEQQEVEEVLKHALTNRLNSLIQPPDKQHPIYSQYSSFFQIYPKDIGAVTMDYVRQPLAPVWDYDISSGGLVFAPAGTTISTNTADPITGEIIAVPRQSQSQDFEMGEQEIPVLINQICRRLSINIREADLFQYIETLKQTNG